MVSDKKKIVKSDDDVSCWSCFTVENDDRDPNPVPLSKIRKENREKLKLYSFLASELSKPKAISLKQKVSENYTVGKKLEENMKTQQMKLDADFIEKLPEENVTIIHKVQIETSTPKQKHNVRDTFLPKIENKIKICDSLSVPDCKGTQKNINNLAQRDKKIISSSNSSDSGYTIPSVREFHEAETNRDSLTNNVKINVSDAAQHDKEVTIENASSNGSESEYSGSSITVPESHDEKNRDSLTITEKIIISDVAQQDKEVTIDNASSNGSDSGYTGSSITVREFHEAESNKDSITKTDRTKRDTTPVLNNSSLPYNLKSSLPTLHLSKSSTLTTSTKSLFTESNRKPLKSIRWSTLCVDQEDVSHSEDEVYVTETLSPGHATLPRRSNSPLPHERDMLDRDRFPINRSGLQARSESMASVYSGAGEGTRSNVTVRGEVQFSLLYNYRLGALEVGVKRCRDLAPVDTKRNRSDPYVKVYLLPDKSKAGKRKTKVKKNTLNPVFEETLSFVQPLASLSSRTLWLSAWHADMFGRNDFLGEVTLPLADVVFDDPAPTWHKLHERTEQFDEQSGTRGDLIIALKFEAAEARGKGTLHVLVKEAKHLAATKPSGLADVFCKSYLLPERGRLAKQKTGVARRTLSPRWEHTFTYRGLRLTELADRALELSLWDRDRLASNDFMGAIRLSLGSGTYMGASVNWMDSTGKEVSLWQTMMQRPNFWVEGSLPLRPQLNN